MRRSLLIFAAYVFCAGSAFAEPFGVQMGTLYYYLDVAGLNQGGSAVLNSVPSPHPDFDYYIAGTTGEGSLCAIAATTQANGNGSELFSKIIDQLEIKYGVIAIARPNEFGRWVSGQPENYEGVREIRLSNRNDWVTLEYFFQNAAVCHLSTALQFEDPTHYEGADVL